MASFLNQVAMSDQLYQQQQKEREDREFELLRRKQEQAQMANDAYLMPFKTEDYMNERQQLQEEYKDANSRRQAAREQEALGKWVVPYEPKTGVNDDGTRQLDVRVPLAPAMAGMAAAGLGTFAQPEGIIRPFDDQAVVNSRSYQTPEEIKKKADLEDSHKKSLELAGARKATPSARASSGSNSTPKTKADPQTARSQKIYDSEYELRQKEFVSKNNRTPAGAEISEIAKQAEDATRLRLGNTAQPPAPATTPPPTRKQNSADADADFDAFEELTAPHAPPVKEIPPLAQTVNLKEVHGGVPANMSNIETDPGGNPENMPTYGAQISNLIRGNWDKMAPAQGLQPEDQRELLDIVNSFFSSIEGRAKLQSLAFELDPNARGNPHYSVQSPAVVLLAAKAELQKRKSDRGQQEAIRRAMMKNMPTVAGSLDAINRGIRSY